MNEPIIERASYGMARQLEIYQASLQGKKPERPVCIEELEWAAREAIPVEAYDYVAGSAGAERTFRANLEAFDKVRIVPRMLRDVSQRDLSIELFGRKLPAPVLLAPIGVQGIVRTDGELAVGRAAASLGVPFALSTVSSHSMEAVAKEMGDAPRWFQLYWSRDHEIAASMVSRAERLGYEAIIVTLDTPLLGWRERDLQHAYLPFLTGDGTSNYFSDPVFRSRLASPPEADPAAAIRAFLGVFANPYLTWDDIPFLRKHTRLPIVLKGILHPEDAAKAMDTGVEGIVVSNHGGRQVDGGIAALDALPKVVERVAGRIPVLFDSGIRRGSDIIKALVLGAKAALIGRPYMWGLAVGGEDGVRDVIINLLADLDVTMALSGVASIAEITSDLISLQPS